MTSSVYPFTVIIALAMLGACNQRDASTSAADPATPKGDSPALGEPFYSDACLVEVELGCVSYGQIEDNSCCIPGATSDFDDPPSDDDPTNPDDPFDGIVCILGAQLVNGDCMDPGGNGLPSECCEVNAQGVDGPEVIFCPQGNAQVVCQQTEGLPDVCCPDDSNDGNVDACAQILCANGSEPEPPHCCSPRVDACARILCEDGSEPVPPNCCN